MNRGKSVRCIGAAVFLAALSLPAQQRVQVAPGTKGWVDLTPVITGISADSQVVPGGTVRVFGRNLAYRDPRIPTAPRLRLGSPPGFGRVYSTTPDPWVGTRRDPDPLSNTSPVTPYIYPENVQWSDTSVVVTLPPPDNNVHTFWGGAMAADTYLQVLTNAGTSNRYPVKFSPLSQATRPSTAYTAGSAMDEHDIQPRNGPPKKPGGSSSAPQPGATTASSISTEAQHLLQIQNQLRTLQAQLATASAADKPRLQEQIRQVQQQILELQSVRPNQVKQ